VHNVADTNCTVLISGESGTGKELVARALHAASGRRDKPFVAINCAAIPDTLIEAELFGHARGAFTSADGRRDGLILSAHGGTLFLDEIGEMPAAAQAKLLRVLQDHTVTPVGSDRPVPVNVRIVAATNRDLEAAVEDGSFRGDLYFRLSVIPIDLPSLRERPGDVMPLARHFLDRYRRELKRAVTGFEPDAEEALRAYSWPGNVRELANTIERAVALHASGCLTAADLRLGGKSGRRTPSSSASMHALPPSPPPALRPEGNLNLRDAIDHIERQYIHQALERTGGNRSEAAALLGLNRSTLLEKIRKLA
jgi:two-component system response regulator HydG